MKNEKVFYNHKIVVKNKKLLSYQNYSGSTEADVICYSLDSEQIINEYGEGENSYGFTNRMFTELNDSLFIYGSPFTDYLYQININKHNNNVSKFCMLKTVSKLPEEFEKITDRNQQVFWIIKNKEASEQLKPFIEMKNVDGLIFIKQIVLKEGYIYTIVDLNGNVLNSIKHFEESKLPDLEEQTIFFSNRLIFTGYDINSKTESNPKLIFYNYRK